MDVRILHSRVQHGVGQGSFHSACVEVRTGGGSRHRFDYVYDCGALRGSAASPALLRSIERLDLTPRPDSAGRPVINALVLSHFDRDHIIGADLLASRFLVKRIFVPYLSHEELMLVLSSQARELEDDYVRQLHGLATGGQTLFGVPITMVQPGGAGEGEPQSSANPDGLPPQGGAGQSDAQYPPNDLEAIVGRGRSLSGVLPAKSNVGLGAMGQMHWTLRFWNRGVCDDLLASMFDALVECGFPVAALQEPTAVEEVVDWLNISANRRFALEAYRKAIAVYKPTWLREASGQRLANFLSLGLFSGPASPESFHCHYEVLDASGRDSMAWWGRRWRRRRYFYTDERWGWLGTGDAPLGEPEVWSDFSQHYASELDQVLTIQVPHHGAAPRDGPKFFNAGLVPAPGVNSVISVGTTNPYGHPRAEVLKEAMAGGACLELVTEESWLGFHEVVVLDS